MAAACWAVAVIVMRSSGVRTTFGVAVTGLGGRGEGGRSRRQPDGIAGVGARPDQLQADAVTVLRHRKLQVLALLQRHLGLDVDRQARDRDPHQIGGQHLAAPAH